MHELTAGVEIAADRDRVWHALADEAAVRSWLSREAAVDLAGGLYAVWGPNLIGVPEQGAIRLAGVETGKRIDLAWQFRGAETAVGITLRRMEGSSFVMVEHSGIPSRVDEQDAALHDFWYVALENLRSFLLTANPAELPDYTSRYGDELQMGITVNADRETVFTHISHPTELNRYFGRGAVVEPRVGGKFSYGWDEGGPVEILAIDPPSRLSFSWEYQGEPSTVVTWSLEATGGKTTITLSHSGFGDETRQDAYRAGWSSFLAIIRSMAELGKSWSMVRIEGAGHGEV
jgi:uncharacterized protein YndB with AHSA1/START domain